MSIIDCLLRITQNEKKEERTSLIIPLNLKTEVICLDNGFKECFGAMIMNLPFVGFLEFDFTIKENVILS